MRTMISAEGEGLHDLLRHGSRISFISSIKIDERYLSGIERDPPRKSTLYEVQFRVMQ